jgi:hypothetical protein
MDALPVVAICNLFSVFRITNKLRSMRYHGKLYGEQRGQRTRYWDTGKTGKDWEDIEKERDALSAKLDRILELTTHDDTYWAIEEIGRLCDSPENSVISPQ